MGSDVALNLHGPIVLGRIKVAVNAEFPIYLKHIPSRGITKDCPTTLIYKNECQVILAKKMLDNLRILGEIPGSLLEMYEKKHNIVYGQFSAR